MESLVVTVIGKDRPGLVESVSAAVEEHGGSWVESRMSRLAGEFAGILRVSVPAVQADALSGALEALRADGLRVMVERGFEEAAEEGHLIVLELVGSDRPGIVHESFRRGDVRSFARRKRQRSPDIYGPHRRFGPLRDHVIRRLGQITHLLQF